MLIFSTHVVLVLFLLSQSEKVLIFRYKQTDTNRHNIYIFKLTLKTDPSRPCRPKGGFGLAIMMVRMKMMMIQ